MGDYSPEMIRQNHGVTLGIYARCYHMAVLIASQDKEQFAQSYSILSQGKRTISGIKHGCLLFEQMKKDEITKPWWIYPELGKKPPKRGRQRKKVEAQKKEEPKKEAPKEKKNNRGYGAIVHNRTCYRCGKPFSTTVNRKIYCDECRTQAAKEGKSVYYAMVTKRKREEKKVFEKRICPVCGGEFETSYSKKIYCSDKCNWKASYALKKIRRAQAKGE